MAGKLDPSASLQAVSISARLPLTAGSMASPRKLDLVRQRRRRQRSSRTSGGSSSSCSSNVSRRSRTGVAIITNTDKGSDKNGNGIHSGNTNNKHGESSTGNRHGDKAAVPRGEDGTTLSNITRKRQQHPGSGTGNNQCERATAVGGASASTELQVNGGCATRYSSTTVFVRSRQWGMRRPYRAGSVRRAPTEGDVLSIHQLAVSGGKRQRPSVLNENSTHGPVARRRSTCRRDGDAGRHDGNTGSVDNGNGNRPPGMSGPSGGAGQDQDEARENAAKAPPATPTSLMAPSVFLRSETASGRTSLSKWRIVPPPADRKLRPNSRRWFYRRGRSPYWSTSTAGTENIQTTTGSGRTAEPETHALPVAAAAVQIENSTSASVATSERRVPQPLSVVAVWARTFSPTGAARNKETTSRPGVHYSKPISSLARSYEEFQDPKYSAAIECGQPERAVGTAPRCVLLLCE